MDDEVATIERGKNLREDMAAAIWPLTDDYNADWEGRAPEWGELDPNNEDNAYYRNKTLKLADRLIAALPAERA